MMLKNNPLQASVQVLGYPPRQKFGGDEMTQLHSSSQHEQRKNMVVLSDGCGYRGKL